MRARRSVPMGGGTLRSCWLEILGLACTSGATVVDAESGEEVPEEAEGAGDSPVAQSRQSDKHEDKAGKSRSTSSDTTHELLMLKAFSSLINHTSSFTSTTTPPDSNQIQNLFSLSY